MTPLEFLREEFENTQRALDETLRHEYGPGREEYYKECARRLEAIRADVKVLTETNHVGIRTTGIELAQVSHAVALAERSRLGEFSWPFANELSDAATSLLTEITVDGDAIPPIVHVVSEPTGYKIRTERRTQYCTARFVTIHFPRQLRHHVLLHALFGHELGHAAISIPDPDDLLITAAQKLSSSGPMSSPTSMTTWLHETGSPSEIKSELSRFKKKHKQDFQFTPNAHISWLRELICDLFGFSCFGPAFVAAHRAYLEKPFPYYFTLEAATHPPYAIRHRILIQAMRAMGWHHPRTSTSDGQFHAAEKLLLNYLTTDPYTSWAQVFDDAQVDACVNAILELFRAHPKLQYHAIEPKNLVALLLNLSAGVPPVLAPIKDDGEPELVRLSLGRILYAGWTHWIGRSAMSRDVNLTFFETNRLCDQALVQQAAINKVLDAPQLKWDS